MDKFKSILKALLFGTIMLLFLICPALISKALKLSSNRALIFQGGMALLSIIVPLFYIGHKNYSSSDIGFNKPTKAIMKRLLFYLPLFLPLCALIIAFNKNTGIKSLVVIAFYALSVSIALEVYFRGVIQKEFRGKFNVLLGLIIIALIYAGCNAYYFNRVTSYKHIMMLCAFSFCVAGITGIVIESKGNIILTVLFNTLYLLLTINYTGRGKMLLLSQGICMAILFVYGLYLLVLYFKDHKVEKVAEPEEEQIDEASNEEFDENGNITLE